MQCWRRAAKRGNDYASATALSRGGSALSPVLETGGSLWVCVFRERRHLELGCRAAERSWREGPRGGLGAHRRRPDSAAAGCGLSRPAFSRPFFATHPCGRWRSPRPRSPTGSGVGGCLRQGRVGGRPQDAGRLGKSNPRGEPRRAEADPRASTPRFTRPGALSAPAVPAALRPGLPLAEPRVLGERSTRMASRRLEIGRPFRRRRDVERGGPSRRASRPRRSRVPIAAVLTLHPLRLGADHRRSGPDVGQ